MVHIKGEDQRKQTCFKSDSSVFEISKGEIASASDFLVWIEEETNNLFVYDLLNESSYLVKDQNLDKMLLNLKDFAVCVEKSKNPNHLTLYVIGGRRT
jgi:hypothetical protein